MLVKVIGSNYDSHKVNFWLVLDILGNKRLGSKEAK